MTTGVNEPPDSAITSFRQQASVFSILNLFVIAALLFLHVLLTPYWGRLSPLLLAALGAGFFFHAVVFMWIQARPAQITRPLVVTLTFASIAVNSVLTLLAAATNHEDSQYFCLDDHPYLGSSFPTFSFCYCDCRSCRRCPQLLLGMGILSNPPWAAVQ